jgi:exodeoxyribonuclease VIII
MQTNNSKIEYFKDTFPEYLGKKDYLASSDIKTFLKSPKMYYYKKYVEVKKQEPERHFSIGSAIHEIVLEPELFNQNYVIGPKFDKRTKEGKAGYEAFMASAEGKTVLFEDEMEMIQQIAENAMNNNILTELIKDSHRELSIYTTDEKRV